MTEEVKERLGIVVEIIGIESERDMLEVTEDGTAALRSKRSEIIGLYDEMAKMYEQDRRGFYGAAPSYVWALPLMLAMGFGTGAMMSYVASVGDASCDLLRSGADAAWDAGGTGGGEIGGDWSGF